MVAGTSDTATRDMGELYTDDMGIQVMVSTSGAVSKDAVDTGELLDMDVAYQHGIADELFSEDETDWNPRCQQLWLDLGLAATGWAWQRDTVALAVALVTGNNTAFGRGILDETDDWCGWVGSNMDRAVMREGHVRLMEFNPRVMAQSDEGEQAQREVWRRARELAVNAVLMPADGLEDPTTAYPKTSLVKSIALARDVWQQKQLVWTHSQGMPGLVRRAVGGASLIADETMAKIQGVRFADSRCWGRFVGRVLVGRDAKRILLITVHFPTEASGEGSAWQTQSRAMQGIDPEDGKANPWMQAVHDPEHQVATFMRASKSQRVREGTSIIIMGDFNARSKHSDTLASTRMPGYCRRYSLRYGGSSGPRPRRA